MVRLYRDNGQGTLTVYYQDAIEGTQDGYVRIYRNETSSSLTIYYGIDGTAVRNLDYVIPDGQITFAVGQEYIDIPIFVFDDRFIEGTKTVSIYLLPSEADAYFVDSERSHVELLLHDNDGTNEGPIVTGNTNYLLDWDTEKFEIDLNAIFDDPNYINGDALSYSITSVEGGVSVTLLEENLLQVVFEEGFHGEILINVKAQDSFGLYVDAALSLTMRPRILQTNVDRYFVDHDGTLIVDADSGVLANDPEQKNVSLTAELVAGPSYGNIQFNEDGSFIYTVSDGYVGLDRFYYRATYDGRTSDVVEVVINVVNDVPCPLPLQYYCLVNDNIMVDVSKGLLSKVTDREGDPLNVILVDFTDTDKGTLVLENDGSFTFIPKQDYIGKITFTYAISDSLSISQPQTVTITVLNEKTIAYNDIYSITYGQSLQINTDNGLLTNDQLQHRRDSVINSLDGYNITILEQPEHGVIDVNQDGSFSYTGDVGFVGTETITYRLTDSFGDFCDATISIVVKAPLLDLQTTVLSTQSGVELQIDDVAAVLLNSNYEHIENISSLNELYRLEIKGDAHFGTASIDENGRFRYLSQDDYVGADVITYQIVDASNNVVVENSIFLQIASNSSLQSEVRSVSDGYNIDPTSENFGMISIGGNASQVGVGSPFIPEQFGNYTSSTIVSRESVTVLTSKSGDEIQGLNTETLNISIVSQEYNDGDWFYTESVHYSYSIVSGDDRYWGGYVYVISASFIGGIYQCTFAMDTEGSFLVFEETTNDTDSTTFSLTSEISNRLTDKVFLTIYDDTNSSTRYAEETSVSIVDATSEGIGNYSYQTVGGVVHGVVAQSGKNKTMSTATILYTDNDNDGLVIEGSLTASTLETWTSSYSGSGDYYFVAETDGNYSDTFGIISENGSETSSIQLNLTGILGDDQEWVFSGAGTSERSSYDYYTANDVGVYWQGQSKPNDTWYIDGAHSSYSEQEHESGENVEWQLINEEWGIVVGMGAASGREWSSYEYQGNGIYLQYGESEDGFWHNSGTLSQTGEGQDDSEYSVTSNFVNGDWINTGSGSGSGLEFSESSYNGTGTYSSLFQKDGTEFSINGNTFQHGFESSGMIYNTTAVLLGDGTWSLTGSGTEHGESEDHSSYDGIGMFTMKIDDTNIIGDDTIRGSVSQDGNVDSSLIWDADWLFEENEWLRTGGTGLMTDSDSYFIGFNGSANTREEYNQGGVSYSTQSTRTIESEDQGNSESFLVLGIENDDWVITEGSGTGYSFSYLRSGILTNGSYHYVKNGSEGQATSGSVQADGEDYAGSEANLEYTWGDSDWIITGSSTYESRGYNGFAKNGGGTFWSYQSDSDYAGTMNGTVTENFSTNSNYSSLSTVEYHADGTSTHTGEGINSILENSSINYNGSGTFSMKSEDEENNLTQISGFSTLIHNVSTHFDGYEKYNIVDGNWGLSEGLSDEGYDEYTWTEQIGTGIAIVYGEEFNMTYDLGLNHWDESDLTAKVTGIVVDSEDERTWIHTGTAQLHEDGESTDFSKLRTVSYRQEIEGGAIERTIDELKKTSDKYQIDTKFSSTGGESWNISSGTAVTESSIDHTRTINGKGEYTITRINGGGLDDLDDNIGNKATLEVLYGDIAEYDFSKTFSEGLIVIATHDQTTGRWEETSWAGSLENNNTFNYSDEGKGFYITEDVYIDIKDRSSFINSSYNETFFLASATSEGELHYQVRDSYDAVATSEHYTNREGKYLKGEYEKTTDYETKFNVDVDWNVEYIDHVFSTGFVADFNAERVSSYDEEITEKFELEKNGSVDYDDYSYKAKDKLVGEYREEMFAQVGISETAFRDAIWNDDAWFIKTLTTKFNNDYTIKEVNDDFAVTIGDVTLERTKTKLTEYKVEKTRDIWHETENGIQVRKGEGKDRHIETVTFTYDGDEVEYEFHNDKGKRDSEKKVVDSVDTTLNYKLDDETKRWSILDGHSTTKDEETFKWKDKATATIENDNGWEKYEVDAKGDITDKLTAEWEYNKDNETWKVVSVSGGKGSDEGGGEAGGNAFSYGGAAGSDGGEDGENETNNGENGGSYKRKESYELWGLITTGFWAESPYGNLELGFDFENFNGEKEVKNLLDIDEDIKDINYEILEDETDYYGNPTIKRTATGETKEEIERFIKLRDHADKEWEEHFTKSLDEISNNGNTVIEGTYTSTRKGKNEFDGHLTDEFTAKNTTVWKSTRYSTGEKDFESKSNVEEKRDVSLGYHASSREETTSDRDEKRMINYAAGDYSGGSSDRSDTNTSSESNRNIDQSEDFMMKSTRTLTFFADGTIMDEKYHENRVGKGQHTYRQVTTGQYEGETNYYSANSWGHFNSRNTQGNSNSTDSSDVNEQFNYHGSRDSLNAPLDESKSGQYDWSTINEIKGWSRIETVSANGGAYYNEYKHEGPIDDRSSDGDTEDHTGKSYGFEKRKTMRITVEVITTSLGTQVTYTEERNKKFEPKKPDERMHPMLLDRIDRGQPKFDNLKLDGHFERKSNQSSLDKLSPPQKPVQPDKVNPQPVSKKGFFGKAWDNLKEAASTVCEFASAYAASVGPAYQEKIGVVHGALDVAGALPVVGIPADLINGVIYGVEGDWTEVAWAGLGMIPFVGDGAQGLRKGKKLLDAGAEAIEQAVKHGDDLADTSNDARKALDNARNNKYAKQEAYEKGEIHKTTIARPPRHHVFPQEHRAWFEKRGIDIDKYTLELSQGEHTAIHSAKWNEELMKRLKKTEKATGRELNAREIWEIMDRLRREFKLHNNFVPFDK